MNNSHRTIWHAAWGGTSALACLFAALAFAPGADASSGSGNPASAHGYRNGADIQSDAFHPASAHGHRNGADIQSEAAR